MNAIDLFREQLRDAHGLLEMTMQDVSPELAQWAPPGVANPIGASYAHAVLTVDGVLNGRLRGAAPLVAGEWAGRMGLSAPPPTGLGAWAEWARTVQVDLDALRSYSQAVYSAADGYLASLKEQDLERPVDMGLGGPRSLSWILNNVILGHTQNHCGEISALKGVQGAKGYPF